MLGKRQECTQGRRTTYLYNNERTSMVLCMPYEWLEKKSVKRFSYERISFVRNARATGIHSKCTIQLYIFNGIRKHTGNSCFDLKYITAIVANNGKRVTVAVRQNEKEAEKSDRRGEKGREAKGKERRKEMREKRLVN